MIAPLPDFAAARRAMVEGQLRPQGVTDRGVLGAMASVPREDFLPDQLKPMAYADRPVRLPDGGSLMPPAALGSLLTRLQPKAGEAALVIGAAPAYARSVLAAMGLSVDTAGAADVAGKGPYDLILIDGAVEDVPTALAGKLAPGGRVGAAIVERGVTRLATGTLAGGAVGLTCFLDADVDLLPGSTRPRAFTF